MYSQANGGSWIGNRKEIWDKLFFRKTRIILRNMAEKADLARLVPLDSLSEENFNDLVKNSSVEKYPAGTVLFKQGDVDRFAIYVLEGTLVLSSNDSTMERTVEGGTEEGLYAVAQLNPSPPPSTIGGFSPCRNVERAECSNR